MLVRRSVPLALAALLAAAGCSKDVSQRAPAPVLVFAAFAPTSPTQPLLPLPNDLALRVAPLQPDPPRSGLLGLIDAGGWPDVIDLDGSPQDPWTPAEALPFRGVYVPIRAEAFNETLGTYAPSPDVPQLDPATINASTVAIVRLDGAEHTVLPPAVVQDFPPAPGMGLRFLVLRPTSATEAIFPPGRWVVALRGGPNGVHATVDGQSVPLQADQAIALIAPNKDLTEPENQPPGGLQPAQIALLEPLRQSYAGPLDWLRVADEATCRAGVPIPEAVDFPGRCWLPAPMPDAVIPAFTGVDQVFPHEEIASIQTFEVFHVTMGLQEEVTP